MKKKSAVPTSKAKTAYGLLSDIARIALAEPKRIRMAQWLADPKFLPDEQRPACGTVGCIGGWAIVLKGTRAQRQDALLRGAFSNAEENAAAILGLNGDDREQAFELFTSDDIRGNAGTVTHARSVAARIRRFQKKYAAQLKSKRV